MAQGDVVALAVTFTHVQIPGTAPVVTLAYQQTSANDGSNTDLVEAIAIATRVVDVLSADMATDVFDDETTIGPCVFWGLTKPTIGGQVPGKVGPGTAISDLLSPRTAVVVTKTSGLRGRSYRGRSYLPFVPEAAQSMGTLGATYVTAYQTIADNLESFPAVGGTGAAHQQVIYSPTLSAERGEVVATPVLQMIVRPRLGSIRGRWKVNS